MTRTTPEKQSSPHEHQWESMGGVTKELWYSENGCSWNNEKRGETVVFAVFCKTCGEIKEKHL